MINNQKGQDAAPNRSSPVLPMMAVASPKRTHSPQLHRFVS